MDKQVVIVFDEDELIWLRRVITDEDHAEALKFLRVVLDEKVKNKEATNGMRAASDASHRPHRSPHRGDRGR
ncbi:MAG: hypothetical protein JJE48_03335 [Actinobacteria bacterium]|nr:hypothetical protein [Actinomycetota bacterium]